MIEHNDTYIRVSPLRRLARIPVFLLVCTIFIWIVYDIGFRKLPIPTAVTVSPGDRGADVVALTAAPMKLCALVYGKSFPFLVISCDPVTRRVHTIRLSRLSPDATYSLLLGSGLHWFRQASLPVGGVLAHESLPVFPLPSISTLSKAINLGVNNAITLIGSVIYPDGTVASDAVIVVSVSGQTKITRADSRGSFKILLPLAWKDAEAELLVWAEDGYVTLPQVLELLDGVQQTVRLEAYAI